MVSKELLEILACPACRGEIVDLGEKDILLCRNCRRAYPVREDIPVMLAEEAELWSEEEARPYL